MSSELGTAVVAWNSGRIRPDAGGGQVRFDIHTFSTISNGSKVYFIRSTSDPSWATYVSLASQVNALTEAAKPERDLTEGANGLLRRFAVRLIAETQFAPEADLAEAHFHHAMALMDGIKATIPLEPKGEPVDETTLRASLP